MKLQKPSRWETHRQKTGSKRTPLTAPATVRITYESTPNVSLFACRAPAECLLAATDSQGSIAPWFTTEFFQHMIEHWGGQKLTLRLQATRGAILHPKIIDQMNRIRSQGPNWRLIAESNGSGLANTPALDRLLTSPYHEICFCVDFLPPDARRRGGDALFQQRVFHAIQKLIVLRTARGISHPKIVWVFEDQSEDESQLGRAEQIARQICVDRFVALNRVESRP
ncbi:MAG: hypothetical protein ACYTF1_24420 [Planctomycetota bacterium]|jgi:hypothetical protein